MNALIGHSGFVGTCLKKQSAFDGLYRSSDIDRVGERAYGDVICAAAPAQKWIANRDPVADRATIDGLIAHLETVRCKRFVLVSTVDVFRQPVGVDEDSPVEEAELHAYGLHRRLLERFVEAHFDEHLIVRLPGLVGPGLRKNAVYDLHHDNNVHLLDSRAVLQYYPMVNLWYDIECAIEAGLRLVHLAAEPISTADVSRMAFGKELRQEFPNPAAFYDMRSRYADVFGGTGPYQYLRRDSLQAIRAYTQSEPRAVKEHS